MMVNEKPVPASPCGQYIKTTFELGKGAQRIVFRGNDLHNGRCVAWCEPKLKGEKEWETFTKTSSLLESVKHKNIVSFIEFWEASPNSSRTPVLITELMGCTLKQHLHTSPRGFVDSAIKSWASQILEAIMYLQTYSSHHVIVHRTLRCDHVCININTGEVKVSSFGSAVLKERGKYLDDPVGQVEFMSPEMAVEHYNESTDIYSYGIVLLEMLTGENPYEECDKLSQAIDCLKTKKYPKILETITCPYSRDLVRSCIEHNVEKRLNLNQIMSHRYFQEVGRTPTKFSNHIGHGHVKSSAETPLPTGWPKISFNSLDGDNMRICISHPDNPGDVQYYSINTQTDQSRYVAASLVRGDYIKEVHLQDAQNQIHKLIEKVKRQTRVKSELMDFYGPITDDNTGDEISPITDMPQPMPVQPKTPKTPKVALRLCSWDYEDQHVELELSQTRIGKIVKFQFGILDNDPEEIAEKMVKEGHLIADNKADFLERLKTIVEEQQDEARRQQMEDVEEDVIEQDSAVKVEEPPPSAEPENEQSNSSLTIEVRRKLSHDKANHHATSPDIDTRSLHSETSNSVHQDTYNSVKSATNGMDSVVSPPIVTSSGLALPPNYYRPTTPGMMLYPPTAQYMMVPPGTMHHSGSIPSAGMHQMPGHHHQIPPNYLMMQSGHIPHSSIYTNGHIAAGWGHGAPMVRSQHDMNNISSMRMPVTAAHHLPYMAASQNQRVEMDLRTVRGDQDTPPPGFRNDMMSAAPLDCRSDT
ncbi:serine/threonine-protein kinase WNK3-like isoform X3 [Bolinopsis microptera]|uniref:serine/threonine-protein kinase WNK3-like isoform X3 n=1 Tax=Bolinopsis microptera TaxID=2820187 RepID=UPI0030791E84